MKKILLLSLSLVLGVSWGYAKEFTLIPRTTAEMQNPNFWISRTPQADQVVLTLDEIGGFNRRLNQLGLTQDLLIEKTDFLEHAKEVNETEWQKFRHGRYYDRRGEKAPPEFFMQIKNNMDLSRLKSLSFQTGLINAMANQRLLPTDHILTSEPFDFEFDEVQNSSLDAGTPVRILFESRDGEWFYTQSTSSGGWVKKSEVTLISAQTFQEVMKNASVVVTSAKALIYLDPQRRGIYDEVRMGARFLSTGESVGPFVKVKIPDREHLSSDSLVDGYLDLDQVAKGFLAYTPQTIIAQAFKLLNAPYGWGGMNGEQDCSAFIKQIFSTVGIDLPRNSAEQGQVGYLQKTLSESRAGITVAQLNGHIVLYLGQVDDEPYAIHAAYAFREHVDGSDQVRVVNRVIVSDFRLGEGTAKGSFLKRIKAIREYH